MSAPGRGTLPSRARPHPDAESGKRVLRVALLGNPNTGKTTLFNALTGMRQQVGNFPGVTVERVEGSYRGPAGERVGVLDLPGSYSLSASSPDEAIALEVLLGQAQGVPRPDVVLVVLDAQNLERNLFLASQLMELGIPLVAALNQVDAAEAAGMRIDVPELIAELGITVIPTVATRGEGIDHLRRAVDRAPELPRPARRFVLPPPVANALAPLEARLRLAGLAPSVAELEALRLLALSHPEAHLAGVVGLDEELARARAALERADVNPLSLEAELRYGWIGQVVERTVTRPRHEERTASDRVDTVLLHRVWGVVIFVALMAVVFQAIFSWAAPLQGVIESGIGLLARGVEALLPAGDLRSLLVNGVLGGAGSVLAFVPQIAILFLFIGFLEDSGYMARAAFVMDRLMRRVGLHGRSFIPMISGYACAVPAIMSTRVIEQPKDRLATIMVVPLMSCSARLPVYALLIGAFIPPVAVAGVFDLQGLTLLAMYLLGTGAALVAAAVFKRTLLRGPVRPMILELPPYRLPAWRSLGVSVTQRVVLFLRRAGTIILALSVVLWALATYPKASVPAGTPAARASELQLEQSALGRMGHAIEPAVRPLGYDWKIGVSMVSSFAAREVFVSTMATIYGVGGAADDGSQTQALRERLRAERSPATGRLVYTPLVALGLMVFYVFAMMCMSTSTITARETGGGWIGWRWAAFQFGYMLVLAYGGAWLVYHGGRALGFAG